MKIPYNHLHAQGSILFAARGGKVHSFSLLDGSYISTWKHPDVDKVASAVKANVEAEAEKGTKIPEGADAVPGVEETERPNKRQRLGEDDESAAAQAVQTDDTKSKHVEGRRKGKKSGQKKAEGPRLSNVPDRPVITQMTSTADGTHLLVISGHDKNVWVFQHDGQGHISQLSQRTMPKRPSSVVIGPDSQIICADKFGDVYSLPLIPTPASSSPMPAASSTSLPRPAYKPAANTFTVHSKRNLDALKRQQQQAAERLAKGEEVKRPEGPDFELTLQLGHVSMLTAVLLAESEGRRYILTSDRDEHIRISRYLPQAHIIESFCLGHKDFVSSMAIPSARGDIVVSGGGDTEVFVWAWKTGRLLSKTGILSLAQTISPEITKVAVSGIYSLQYPSGSGNQTYILAICEDIKAIFSWHLTDDNTLNRPGVIQLPGKPLHLTVYSTDGEAPKIMAAIDPEETPTKSLHVFTLTMSDGRLAVDTDTSVEDEAQEADEVDIPESEIRSLLNTVENLRKYQAAEAADDGKMDVDAEAEDAPEEAP